MATHKFTSAKHAAHFSGTFECRHCGLDAPALVYARGGGAANGHGEGSAQAAFEDAEADANRVAARTLTFYPCPKCGKVDPSSGSFRAQVIIGSLILGAITGFLLYMLFGLRGGLHTHSDREAAQIAGMISGGVVALCGFFFWGRAWWGVQRRVRIDMANATMTPRDDY